MHHSAHTCIYLIDAVISNHNYVPEQAENSHKKLNSSTRLTKLYIFSFGVEHLMYCLRAFNICKQILQCIR